MENQETNNDSFNFYYNRYFTESDSEILKILRNHKDYQEAAVNAAVKIAVERELIHSEQDLLSPEFQQTRIHRFTIFPQITNAFHQKRLIDSIFRFLYILAMLPVVYGAMSYAEGRTDRALEGIGLGIIWGLLCFYYRKSRKSSILILLFAILVVIFIGSIIRIISHETLNVLDLVMVLVGTIMPAYLLLYVKQLLQINIAED